MSQAEVQFKIDAASIADAFRRLMVEQTQIPVAMTRVTVNGDLARVYVDRHGHIHYKARDTTNGWQGELARLLPIICAHAELAEYGLIRRIYSPAVAWRGITDQRAPRPPVEKRTFRGIPRELENSWVPDAYPVQLLTDQHLEKANDLTGWRTERLSDRLHLVSHPDPAAWLGVDEPDADLVAQARGDFGDMIARRKHW